MPVNQEYLAKGILGCSMILITIHKPLFRTIKRFLFYFVILIAKEQRTIRTHTLPDRSLLSESKAWSPGIIRPDYDTPNRKWDQSRSHCKAPWDTLTARDQSSVDEWPVKFDEMTFPKLIIEGCGWWKRKGKDSRWPAGWPPSKSIRECVATAA